MKSTFKCYLVSLSFFVVIGCRADASKDTPTPQSDDAISQRIPGTQAEGKVANREWIVSGAKISSFMGGNGYSLTLSDEKTGNSCDPFETPSSARRLIAGALPLEAGIHRYSMNQERLLTFSYKDSEGNYENHAGDGVVIIDEVLSDHIIGRIDFKISNDNFVSGRFEAVICSDDSKKDQYPEETQPAAEPTPEPADDSSLLGVWEANYEGIISISLSFTEVRKLNRRITSSDGEVDVDVDSSYQIDQTVTPHRLTETIIDIRSDKGLGDQIHKGEIIRCIFEQKDIATLVIECGDDDSYPVQFTDEKETYKKK